MPVAAGEESSEDTYFDACVGDTMKLPMDVMAKGIVYDFADTVAEDKGRYGIFRDESVLTWPKAVLYAAFRYYMDELEHLTKRDPAGDAKEELELTFGCAHQIATFVDIDPADREVLAGGNSLITHPDPAVGDRAMQTTAKYWQRQQTAVQELNEMLFPHLLRDSGEAKKDTE